MPSTGCTERPLQSASDSPPADARARANSLPQRRCLAPGGWPMPRRDAAGAQLLGIPSASASSARPAPRAPNFRRQPPHAQAIERKSLPGNLAPLSIPLTLILIYSSRTIASPALDLETRARGRRRRLVRGREALGGRGGRLRSQPPLSSFLHRPKNREWA